MECRAIVAVEKGKVQLSKWPVAPPQEGEIQIRNAATLISPGTERAFILGLDNAQNTFPFVPGYCCAGYVNQLGKNVTGFEIGDRICAFALDVGHREIGNVPAHKVVKVPRDVSFDDAVFAALGQVSMQAVRKCGIELGESVAVLGLGIIGLLAMQFAKAAGGLPVIGIDRNDKRLALAAELGADFCFNNAQETFGGLLDAATEGKGPSVVLEGTGFPDAVGEACMLCGRMGRVALLGSTRGISEVNFYRDVHKKGLTLIGAHAECIPRDRSYPLHWTYHDDVECFFKLLRAGSVHVKKMVDLHTDYAQAEEVYSRLLSWDKNLLGAIIHWEN